MKDRKHPSIEETISFSTESKQLNIISSSTISSTYDHRVWRTGLPVRSAVLKPHAGELVVRWVTTSESSLLYVFVLFFLHFMFLMFWIERYRRSYVLSRSIFISPRRRRLILCTVKPLLSRIILQVVHEALREVQQSRNETHFSVQFPSACPKIILFFVALLILGIFSRCI